jgi:threonine 3-dehydrogenase
MTMPHSMAAPHFRGAGLIEFDERPVPEPGPGQLLLRVLANAICGTDRAQFHEGSPVIPGHETAGEVVAVGPGTDTSPGTVGVVFLMDYCGRCRSCRLGHTNQCLDKRADMGFTADGGYGPFELVHETNFFPTPDVAPDEATLLLDVMGTSSHAISRAQQSQVDVEAVGIAGAGPIGLGLAAMSRLLLGPEVPVLVSDTNTYRLDLAESLGAVAVRVAGDSLVAATRRLGLDGLDAAFDASGRQVARDGLLDALTPRRGVLVCVGHGEGLQIDVSSQLIAPERAIVGSEYFRYDELPSNLQRLRQHRPYLRGIITHRFPVDRIDGAFATFLAGHCGKVVVEQEKP